MRGWLVWLTRAILGCLIAAVPLHATELRPYAVDKYDVSLRADFVNQRLEGEAKIQLHGTANMAIAALEFDAAGIHVSDVFEGSEKQSFEQHRNTLFVVVSQPVHQDEPRTLTIQYSAGPSDGLKFFADQIVAADVTSWLPCNNSPVERAALHLTLSAPAEMLAEASGQLISTRAAGASTTTEWQSDLPAGFVVGKFAESSRASGGLALRTLGAPDAPSLEPARAFFAERTGKNASAPVYTEAFTHADMVRTFPGLTILPEADAKDMRLRSEQLAHQWFGIAITPKDAADAWITASLPAWLASAFSKQEMDQTRQAYYQLRSAGSDPPLADATNPDVARTKGLWFLYLLDQLIGDTKFSQGLKLFTTRAWDHSGTSEDLQKAFDGVETGPPAANKKKAARQTDSKSIDKLFDAWVYGVADVKVKSKR